MGHLALPPEELLVRCSVCLYQLDPGCFHKQRSECKFLPIHTWATLDVAPERSGNAAEEATTCSSSTEAKSVYRKSSYWLPKSRVSQKNVHKTSAIIIPLLGCSKDTKEVRKHLLILTSVECFLCVPCTLKEENQLIGKSCMAKFLTARWGAAWDGLQYSLCR
jgi:hypothetical protein